MLGPSSVSHFGTTFGVSFGMKQISDWQDILYEAAKAVVIMLVLERLFLSSPLSWMEEHIDYLSVQAVMLHENMGLWRRIWTHVSFTTRLVTSE